MRHLILIFAVVSATAHATKVKPKPVDVACFNRCYKAMLENPKTKAMGGNIPWCLNACPELAPIRPAIERGQ